MSAKLVASVYENVLSVYCEMIEIALASSSDMIRCTGHALFVNQFSPTESPAAPAEARDIPRR